MRTTALSLVISSLIILSSCSTSPEKDLPSKTSTDKTIDINLSFIGEARFPTGYQFKNTEVGGLSGLDYHREKDIFFVISDDRASKNYPRFYTIKMDLSDGKLQDGDIRFLDVFEIKKQGGNPYSAGELDPESIRVNSNNNKLYWSSEGDKTKGIPPTVQSMDLEGAYLEGFHIPNKLYPKDGQGIRNNKSLESLSLSAKTNKYLYTATEAALYQDGPAETYKKGSAARLLKFDIGTRKVINEYIYFTDPIVERPFLPGLLATNGLVEMLEIYPDHFLALERSFSLGKGNSIRLYLTSTVNASEVKNKHGIANEIESINVMPKELILDLNDLNIPLDNIEGLSFGPQLPGGEKSLILVSDNNFNSAGQFTQFLAFKISLSEQSLK